MLPLLVTAQRNKTTIAAVIAATTAVGSLFSLQPEKDSSALVRYQTDCNKAHAWFDLYVSKTFGYGFTDGEAHRPEITALAYAKQGIGIANSLHTKRLARDKFLVVNGKVVFDNKYYAEVGPIWEAIGPVFKVDTAWGGRFGDAVHFSCAWEGVK